MKKIFALVLVCAFAIAFVACGNTNQTTTEAPSTTTEAPATTTPAAATTPAATTTVPATTTPAATTTTRGAVVVPTETTAPATTTEAQPEVPSLKSLISVAFADGKMVDAAGNMTFKLEKGATVEKTKVKHAGKEYTVDALNIKAAGQGAVGSLNDGNTIASGQEFFNRDFSYEAFYVNYEFGNTAAAVMCATENTAGKRGGAGIADDNGNPYFCIGVGGSYPRVDSQFSTSQTELTHVIGVYDKTAKELRIYVNGKLAGTTSISEELVAIQDNKLANQLGFGFDVSMKSVPDFLAKSYVLVSANMYDAAVTNEQAATLYADAVANLSK